MDIHVNAISEEQLAEFVALVRANHAETTATLAALGAAMATLTQTINEIAAGLRGPLATSILDLIAERDAAEAARVEAVNALARERGEEEVEEAEQSTATEDLRDAFNDVAGLFEDKKLPDVDPLPADPTPEPEVPADDTPVEPLPTEDEPVVDDEPDVPTDEQPTDETPDVPADEPVVDDEPEAPADDADVQPSAPADEPVDDGSGAVTPADDASNDDVPTFEPGGSDDGDVAPNPGAEAQEN